MDKTLIENIKKAVKEKRFNDRISIGDHVVSKEEREKYIIPYDCQKKKISNKFKNYIANIIADLLANKINKKTEIIGLENIKNIDGQAIITCNHFSPYDSLIIRHLMSKIKKQHKFDIMVAESNIFMGGKVGWILKNCNTFPFCNSLDFLNNNFYPSIKKFFEKKHFVLIYPEQEMWLNYKKPRPQKPGAFHIALKFNVPIISCFISMKKNTNNQTIYTLYISKPLLKNDNFTFSENKKMLLEKDFSFKKECYEKAYNTQLDYTFSDDDIF